ncbi:glycosyltransferase family 2 protein [Sphingobium sp. AS12]|uniref:glycosyltransferase family 2 protein n=1 Tax=Sphingobium sp. AS12 TaxID=2849495 RepID=UPI001C31AF15|nr:glycosyltransferase family A protein [Sphingobium sp. AS12]MBV2149747.1 glycosyltransferase family 2 protein [Sphingobium sp. AS12]
MSTAPKVDIVCTFLNAADTLPATLRGLAAQSEAAIRIILIDDGSTDNSAEITRSFGENDPRFVFAPSETRGRGHALNQGLRMGDAPMVAIMDADDVAHPKWIEDSLRLLDQDVSLAALSFARIYIGPKEQPAWDEKSQLPAAKAEDLSATIGTKNPLPHSGACIRRSAIEAVGGYDITRKSHFDYNLWVRLVAAGLAIGRSPTLRVAKRYHADQKFARMPDYHWNTLQVQLHAIRTASRHPMVDSARAFTAYGNSYARYLRRRFLPG